MGRFRNRTDARTVIRQGSRPSNDPSLDSRHCRLVDPTRRLVDPTQCLPIGWCGLSLGTLAYLSTSSWMMRVVVGIVVTGLILGACSGDEVVSPSTSSRRASTSDPGTTTAMPPAVATTESLGPPTTVDRVDGKGRVGLYRADPVTLERQRESPPITRGDAVLSAASSRNGNWLVLNVGIESEPEMSIVRVVDVGNGLVVTETTERSVELFDIRVGDDGTIYALAGPWPGLRLLRLELGGSSFETVFDGFPDRFVPWRVSTVLDDDLLGWFGTFGAENERPSFGLMIADLSDGTIRSYPLAGVTFGLVEEHDLGVFVLEEFVEPGLIWDVKRSRALVVHADQRVISVVDLSSGDVAEHSWIPETSWIERLSAALIPPARADQPSFGTARDAVLSPDGTLLYVATSTGELVMEEDENWSITSIPLGVEVLSTESWEQITSWDIPASQVTLSPDGDYVIATGVTMTDRGSDVEFGPGGVFIIDTAAMRLKGQIDGDWTEHPNIEFSQDGSLAYLNQPHSGEILVIDLSRADVIRTIQGAPQLAVFDQGRLIVTSVP